MGFNDQRFTANRSARITYYKFIKQTQVSVRGCSLFPLYDISKHLSQVYYSTVLKVWGRYAKSHVLCCQKAGRYSRNAFILGGTVQNGGKRTVDNGPISIQEA